jgi:hypothetical protein
MVAKTQSKVDQHFAKQYLRTILSESSLIAREDDRPEAKELRNFYKNEIKLTRAYLAANKLNCPLPKRGRARAEQFN